LVSDSHKGLRSKQLDRLDNGQPQRLDKWQPQRLDKRQPQRLDRIQTKQHLGKGSSQQGLTGSQANAPFFSRST